MNTHFTSLVGLLLVPPFLRWLEDYLPEMVLLDLDVWFAVVLLTLNNNSYLFVLLLLEVELSFVVFIWSIPEP